MLLYGAEFVLIIEIKLPSAHLIADAQFNPMHNDYVIKHIIPLERLDEY